MLGMKTPNILIVMVDQLNGTLFSDGPEDWLHLPFPLLEIEIYKPLPSWYLPFGNTSNCFAFNRFMSSPVHNSVYKVG